jgi:hypothetical protein
VSTASSNFINFRHLQSELKLFKSGTDLDEYWELVSQLRQVFFFFFGPPLPEVDREG